MRKGWFRKTGSIGMKSNWKIQIGKSKQQMSGSYKLRY